MPRKRASKKPSRAPAASIAATAAPDLCLPSDPIDATAIAVLEDEGDPPIDGGDDVGGTMPPPAPVHVDAVRNVRLDVPLLRSRAYARRYLANLTPIRAKALRDLADGLQHEGEKVNGRPVRSPDDALAWLLDRLA